MKVLDIRIDDINKDEALKIAADNLSKAGFVVTPNPEMAVLARKNLALKEAINNSTLSIPDGAGLKLAGVKNKIPGCEFFVHLCEIASKKNVSVFLFGAKEGVAKSAGENLIKMFPELKIAGIRNGYFKSEEKDEIIEEIKKSGAGLVAVCLGAGAQEEFAQGMGDVPALAVCLGGTLDVLAGNVKRAPVFFRKLNLEWAYRALTSTAHFKRLTFIPKFLAYLALDFKKRN